MGQDLQQLEAVFEKVYHSRQPLFATGQFKAEAGKGLLGKLVARMLGIPIYSDFKPATLFIDRHGNHDVWHRDFGGKKFLTLFYDAGELKVERDGFLKVYFKMIFGKSVHYHSAGVSIGKFRSERFIKIISNNYPVNDHEWDFEVIIQTRKSSSLIFKYWGRMKVEKEIPTALH
jgi:hypothetical protein